MEATKQRGLNCARNAAVGCMLLLVALGSGVPTAVETAPVLLEQTRVSDRLYLGRVHAAGVVGEEEWAAFLAEEVTPRFPEGLTVWLADGQWRDGTNRVTVREPTFVLEVVHPHRANRDAHLRAVVSAYKQRFSQQSVLWVRDRVTVVD